MLHAKPATKPSATPDQASLRSQPLAGPEVRRLDFERRFEAALRLRAVVFRFRALANDPPAEFHQAAEAATGRRTPAPRP